MGRLRDLSQALAQQQPTADSAQQLHAELSTRAHAIRELHGLARSQPLASAGWMQPPASVPNATVVRPVDYGADPTGKEDSSAAMHDAIQALAVLCTEASGPSHLHLAFNISDCGGATLDLTGGSFLLSQPIVVPSGGNIHIRSGSLRASSAFPRAHWLVEFHSVDCDHMCHEDVTFTDIYFDSNRVAAGGLLMNNTMGCAITDCYFIGFWQAGVNIISGHEVLVSGCWLGEVWWNEPVPIHSQSIAILVDGNDHVITDTIIFAYANIGIEVPTLGRIFPFST